MPPSVHSVVDSHCHLDFTAFDEDRTQVLLASAQKGVSTIVVPGTTCATWHRTINTCTSAGNSVSLVHALGMHPIFIDQHQPQHLSELKTLAQKSNALVIGEIGLDFHRSLNHTKEQKEKQLLFFEKQLLIAKQLDLPVIVHNRKAHDECLSLLSQHRVRGGIIHAFNGSFAQAAKYAELGFYLGFGGMLTYDRSTKLHKLVKSIDIQHIVLETDAPDMTVENHRGERNSPEYLPDILHAVAQHKSLDPHFVAVQTTRNVSSCLSLPHD